MVFFSSWEGEKISLVDATSRVARQPSKPPSDIAFGLQMALHQRWMDGRPSVTVFAGRPHPATAM